MRLQPSQVRLISMIDDEYLTALVASGPALTAESGGAILACAGIARTAFRGGYLWAFVAQDAGRHMVKLDRCMRRFLDAVKITRIEATVEAGFSPGCRWLEILGFEYEGLMKKYGPSGDDHLRYARVV